MNIYCVVNQTGHLSEPTRKVRLDTPLAYSNTRAHSMRFTVLAEGSDAPATLTGVGVTAQFLRKGDNTTVTPINGTVSGNVCEVVLPASCYNVPGRFVFTMDIGVSGTNPESRTVLWVEGMVERNISGEIIDPGTPVPNITQAINNANAAASAASTAATAANYAAASAVNAIKYVAPPETTTTASQAYAVDDYLIYNGNLYRVKSPIASGGTIDTTGNDANVIKINDGLGQEIKSTKEDFEQDVTDLRGAVTKVQKAVDANDVTFTTGGYISTNKNASAVVDLTPTSSTGYAYAIVSCKYKDAFVLTGTGGGTPRLWAFLNSSNQLISKADGAAVEDGLLITAPFNAAKFVVNVSVLCPYNCIIHPSDFVQDLTNESKLNVAFDESKAIDTHGTSVACTVGTDNTVFTKTQAFAYCCAVIPCNLGDKITITGKSTSSTYLLWAFVNRNGTVIRKAAVNADVTDEVIEVQKNEAYCIINAAMTYSFSATLYYSRIGIDNDYTFSSGYITTPSANTAINFTPNSSTTFAYAIIDCVKGQKFRITGVTENNSGRRLYCFADMSGYCRYRYNDTTELIDAEVTAPVNGKLIVNVLINRDYAVTDSYPYALRSPLTTLPPSFLGSMAFKPMGALGKGYICLMTDDGYDNGTDKGLVHETIPLAIAKDVPFTFALMRDSDVCKDATLLAAVKSAVAEHGCSIAQHGEFTWESVSEDMLNTFFDLEKAFWDSEGIEVKGAVVPAHYTTELVKAVCGGRFGVVRSGYDGIIPGTQNPSYTVTNHYSYYTSGEQSNLYCLSSYNNAGVTDAYNQAAVDYAQANNKILICYFHENAMDATKWGVVSDMIDYAKTKGLTFITLGDIPYLLNN